MCGIYSINTILSEDKINKVSSLLSNRGPDYQNNVIIDNITIGHTLLRIHSDNINDSIQPLYSNDNSLLTVVNGEIYNYQELRDDLENSGYIFKTNSDCEVLVHGLHRDKENFINKINGEFCFISYDLISKTWLCGVDRYGTKPLKYYINDNVISFASDIKTLKILNDIIPRIDFTRLSEILSTQCIKSGYTLFKNVMTLQAGHYIKINHNVEIKDYRVNQSYKNNYCSLEYIEYLIESSILKRYTTKHNVAVTLSSGIDSTAISYYMKKNNLDFKCYFLNFIDSQFSEYNDVKEYCIRNNIDVDVLNVKNIDIQRAFEKTVLNAETMVINPHTSGKWLLNNYMKSKGHKVCYTGDGADELFYGYQHFHTDDLFQFITNSENTGRKYEPLLNKDYDINIGWMRNLTIEHDARRIYSDYWLCEYGLKNIGDSQSYNIGQEHRYPFLDNDLWEYIDSIDNWKQINSPSKNILRTIVSKWDSSSSVIPKKPFMAEFINSEWEPLIRKYIFDNKILDTLGIFNMAEVRKWYEELIKNNTSNSSIITTQLLSLSILLCQI